jgi:hypothetical protein
VPGQTWGFKFPRFDHGNDIPYRYPSQIAEIALGLLVLGALYVVDKRLGREKRPRGVLIATFFTLYFIGRFIVEYWKEYEPPLAAGTPYPTSFTKGQLLSLPGIALGLFGLYWSFKNRIPVGWPGGHIAHDEEEEKPAKRKAKTRDEEEDEEEDDEAADEEPVSRRPQAKSPSKAKKTVDDEDDDELDDDETDDDELDDDETDDDEARKRDRDADIDDEFDEKGALKRRRGPPGD